MFKKIILIFTGVAMIFMACSVKISKENNMATEKREIQLWTKAVADGPCSGPEYNQMDFWVGEWDLRSMIPDTTSESGWKIESARNSVRKILDGCVIEESFDGSTIKWKLLGKSYSTYRKRDKRWYQTWVDNSGSYMPFTGIFEEDRKIFRMEVERKGQKVLLQMIFYKIEENSLTWDWERSVDDGKTWNLKWRIEYTRRM
ncbi:MAG: hypothetical protein IH880_05175 [Candidatus Marinimicrobia bacterium]|nr:hypothetical protein [Candidatus Neomarinimicrobiota bacterium]